MGGSGGHVAGEAVARAGLQARQILQVWGMMLHRGSAGTISFDAMDVKEVHTVQVSPAVIWGSP